MVFLGSGQGKKFWAITEAGEKALRDTEDEREAYVAAAWAEIEANEMADLDRRLNQRSPSGPYEL